MSDRPVTRSAEAAPAPTDQDLRDALVAAVNGHTITPDLAWAIIHRWDAGAPVAVPGPASVSPADTIRRAFVRPVEGEDGMYEWDAETDEELLAAPVALDALLAVGERDKAALADALHGRDLAQLDTENEQRILGEVLAERERDRRQIARLTDALKRIAYGNVEQRGSFQVSFADASNFARAVLADEEDARP